MSSNSDHLLSELSDSAFDLPALEFEEDDVDLDQALIPTLKKKRDILVEVDEYFKKVITLDDEKQDLKTLFRLAVYNDPELRHYSYVPFKFQIFSQKFNTWVDLDYNDVLHLNDGTHLKAVYRDKSARYLKHKRKSKRRDLSPNERKKKRRRVSSDVNYEACSSKRSKTSCSSDEDQSLVTTTVLDEPNNAAYRACNKQYNVPGNYCAVQYNRCSVSSTTLTMSATNFVMSSSSKHVKSKVYNEIEDEIEEGEMRDEDNQKNETFNEIIPASQGELYRLSLGLEGKHPISALHELCRKLRCEPPVFEILEEGFVADPKFLMQVTVQGKSYIPDAYARKKKEAKKLAAEYCLKQMGVYK